MRETREYTLRVSRRDAIAAIAAAALSAVAAAAGAEGVPAQRVAVSPTRPPITIKLVPFGAARKAQMADYSQRHYHQHACRLTSPKVVVLHHTGGARWQSAWWTFAGNTAYASIPGKPEKPGLSAHFIVDKDGTIYQCLPLALRGRHAVGLNWTSIGIEFVQEMKAGKDGRWMDRRILGRTAQVRAGLRLVRYLCARFGIRRSDVIGHAMANDSSYFKDFTGIKNGAGDWFTGEVSAFRARL
jgi:N-acetylmuramoyl-L-alanine amidase